MSFPVLEFDANSLVGKERFHTTFAMALGFFNGYGRNMDAWIDCMSYLRAPEAGMTRFRVEEGETLTIVLRNYERFRDAAPEQGRDLIECAAAVNLGEIERGAAPLIALAF